METTKPWYTSKTLWFNVLFFIVSLAGYFGYGDFKPNSNTVELIAIVGAALNFVLRLITNKGIRAR